MPKFTYPIVFIKNEETGFYNGYIPDLAIWAEGKVKEEVYEDMQVLLKNYIDLATQYDVEIPSQSTLDAISIKWVGYKVSLISVETK